MFDLNQLIFSFKRLFSRRDIMLLVGLVILFFLTRLINLKNIPVFCDEGIYIHWAQIAWHDASWRFISLTDGKQPLHIWGIIPFLKLFPTDALLAGRLFSVSTGFVALIGMFSLCYYAFNKKAAYIGALLYILTPYFLFYDRMTLADSAVNAGFIWILFFSMWLAKKRNLDIALMFGVVAGMTLLAKSSARLFVMLSAFAPILFYDRQIRKWLWKSINYYVLFSITVVIAIVMYNVQRLSPYLHYVAQKNATFVMTSSEFLHDPFRVVGSNLYYLPLYISWELGWLMVIFGLLGVIKLFKVDRRLCIYLLLWFVLPFIAVSLFAKVLFPRYVIFLGTLVTLFATYYFSQLDSRRVQRILIGVFALTLIVLDYPILFKAEDVSMPPIDRGQYINGVTAVWGAEEMMQFIREQSLKKPSIILAEGNFGLVGDVLEVYHRPTDNFEIRGLWPLDGEDIAEYQSMKDKKVYIVFSHRNEFPPAWPIKMVKKYMKPDSDEALYLFEYSP